MATAAPPPLSSSTEKTNGAKLRRLLIDGGTTVLRNTFDGFHPPAKLAASLSANYLILSDLLRDKILNQPQWDEKLFPRHGTPRSETFDISLFCVLLRNICGLSPPRTGWDNMPHKKVKSLAANIVRLKLFRNVLEHKSTTGVDTPTFTALWQEISVALVSLGLDQAEIDRLKAEHCGEDDYLYVLFEWVKSEEDVKSILKEAGKTQEKALKEVKQEVEKGHQTQVKTLQEVKQEVEKGNQTQEKAFQKVKQEVEKGHQTQAKALHEVKQEVEKGHQTQEKALQKVRHEVEKGHQTQENAFKEVRRGLEKVHEIQEKAFQGVRGEVKKVHETQEEDREMLHQLKQSVEKGQETSAQTLEEIKKLHEYQHVQKQAKEKERADEVLTILAKSDFKGDIEYHSDRFQAGTREWVFKAVVDWLDDRSSQHRVMVISGNAGMGKSVISAVISKRMQEAGRLAGSHFCQHNNARYRNPQLMLQSLACHLCRALPEYKSALVEQLSRNVGVELNSMGVQDLFALLFKEPLSNLPDPGRNMLMVIDALDESEYEWRSELLDVVSNQFCRLPGWIRFLVTTRPERNIAECLKGLNPLLLKPTLAKNLEDIQLFFDKQLHHMMRQEHVGAILEELVRKSEGVFLYAYFLVEHIEKNVSSLDLEHLESSLPLGISSVYLSYFKRLESEVCKELPNGEDKVLNLLCAVTAAREPLPLSFVSRILSPNTSSVTARRVANKIIGCVSALLPIHHDHLHIFHKSVKDWLTDTSSYGEHDFTVDGKEGHQILSKLCADELDEVKRRGVLSTEVSATEKYALQHGVRHMLHFDEESRLSSMEELVANYVTDLELLYAKLCVNFAAASDDIVHVKKAKRSESLSEEMQNTLDKLLVLFGRNGGILKGHPRTVFQVVLNEGGPQLSLKAAEVLRSKCPEVPYMEYLDKEDRDEAVKARMDCGSGVDCFDVSPNKDYMVCQCSDNTIQLWSLHTCTREWMHSAEKGYLKINQQSVVFHPEGDCVLPGILSNAYSISGEWVPLFPTSCCSFSICAFSGDKTRLLTDCADDHKHVAIWSMENGAEIQRIVLEEDIKSLAYSKDGDRVAISDSTNCIYLYNVQCSSACLLGKVMVEKCDAMLFSPNSETLVCHANFFSIFFLLSVKEICDSSGVSQIRQSRQLDRCWFWPLDSDSLSKCGFLSKDRSHRWFEHPLHALPFPSTGYFYMIDKDTALISHEWEEHVIMLSVEDEMVNFELPWDVPTDAVFSLDGANVYEIKKHLTDGFKVTVAVFDVSSRKVKGQSSFTRTSRLFPVIPVKGGVLLLLENRSPELWNEDVTQCVQTFSQLTNIKTVVPVSEEVVACGRNCSDFGFKVDVLNTVSGEILSSSIIPVSGDVGLLGCNSQYQSFIYTNTWESSEMQLSTQGLENGIRVSCWDKTSKLWETNIMLPLMFPSPTYSGSIRDDFVVMWNRTGLWGVHVLDARTGARLNTLLEGSFHIDCALLSDGESLVCCSKSFVWLFNVRSGELLSVLDFGEATVCVAACHQKPLIAVGTRLSGLKLIRVHLPLLEDSAKQKDRKTKRIK